MLEDLIKNNKIAVACAVLALLLAGLILPNFTKVSKNTTNIDDMLAASFSGNTDGSDFYIDISGAVNKPGVYRMRPGSRMIDLVKACGGFRSGAQVNGLNLAQALKDGDKITVPSAGKTFSGDCSGQTAAGKVNINAADQKTLESVPGIGLGTAKKILEYRASKGQFAVPEDLKKISGIGPSKYEKLKQYIDVY